MRNVINPANSTQQAEITAPTSSRQSRRSKEVARSSRLIDGVMYTDAVTPFLAELPAGPASASSEHSESDKQQKYWVGCIALEPDPEAFSRFGPEPQTKCNHASRRHSPASPPTNVPRTRNFTDLRSSASATRSSRRGPWPSTLADPAVMPSEPGTQGERVKRRPEMLRHKGLQLHEQYRISSVPENSQSNRSVPMTMAPDPIGPIRLSTRSYLIRYGTMQPTELDAGMDGIEGMVANDNAVAQLDAAVSAYLESERKAIVSAPDDLFRRESNDEPPVLPQLAVSLEFSVSDSISHDVQLLVDDEWSTTTNEETRPVLQWYEYFQGLRDWTYEDVTEKYEATYKP